MNKKKVLVISIITIVIVAVVCITTLLIVKEQNLNNPVGIRITSLSHKTSYYVGEKLNTDNLSISLYSEKGEIRVLSAEEYVIEGFDSSKAGNLTLTVRYGEFTTNYGVVVKEIQVSDTPVSIEIYQLPTKTVYAIGEELKMSGCFMKVNNANGTSKILPVDISMTYGFSSDVAGTVTVNVKYLNMYTSFEVTIVDPEQSN